MKILHGMVDVAGQAIYSVEGLKKIGEIADLVVWKTDGLGYPEIGVDMKFNKKKFVLYPLYMLKMIKFGCFARKNYDVFHFHYGYSLFIFCMDIMFLRKQGKKVFMEFHGSEIRFCYLQPDDKKYPFYRSDGPSAIRKIKNRLILRYSDGCIVHDEELRQQLPIKNVYVTPLRINMDTIIPYYPDKNNDVPVIVHAPTNFKSKGTKYFLNAIERLKENYNIKLILVHGKTQDEALEIYKKADIIVDQLLVGTYGVFAIESMALGKPVVSYINEEYLGSFPDDLPIVNANKDTIYDVLANLVSDAEERNRIGICGRVYAEKYHDNQKVAKLQKMIYCSEIEPMTTKKSFEIVSKL